MPKQAIEKLPIFCASA